jgi:predicted AlkP superfamily pyrophosphatase or phosphodiesterase
MLTGAWPDQHGIVANGWLFRETREVRFWQQSNALLQAEPVYATARRLAAKQGRRLRIAKHFWWFNQGAEVDFSLTPKPHYGADGSKVFGIWGEPPEWAFRLERSLGKFPFHTFWGPKAGLPCTQWIAAAAAEMLKAEAPDLSLVYLPHLDYDPQRFGPSRCDMPRLVRELDDACAPLLDAAAALGARVWVVSEYGHVDVTHPILINRALREAGYLTVRRGPFGEQLETFHSRAFAVCDHQLAHVYVRDPSDLPRVADLLSSLPGVSRVLAGEERSDLHLDHPRSGELIALSAPDSWFAYPFWLDDLHAPDYTRTVDIHRKPGYDPCELLLDPGLRFPMARIAWRLFQKKLGLRTLFDVIPLSPHLILGSHGLPSPDPSSGSLLLSDGPEPSAALVPMTGIRNLVLEAIGLDPAEAGS